MVRRLGAGEWRLLRATRLRALEDAPRAFGSTHAAELAHTGRDWRDTVVRWAWFVAERDGACVGLAAGLPSSDGDPTARALISMWVDPGWRGTGAAEELVAAVCDWARADGARRLRLRVTEGNMPARRFYARLGFTSTGDRKPLRSNPDLDVEEFTLDL